METLNLLIQATLFLIMIGIGSSVEFKEIKKIFRYPKKITIGLILQMVLFPLVAIILALIIDLPGEYKIGIILLAACPGGTLSNFISYLVKADVPLSVSLTSINSIFTIFTIPLFVFLSFLIFSQNKIIIKIPFSIMFSQIFMVLLVPLIIGFLIKYFMKKKSVFVEKPIKIISTALLLILFTIKLFIKPEIPFNEMISIAPYLLILNFMGIFLGYVVSKRFNLPRKSSVTLGVEVGLQNTVLALLITDVILNNPIIGYPALIYASFSFFTTFVFSLIFIKNNKR